jgi:hypothetical protein
LSLIVYDNRSGRSKISLASPAGRFSQYLRGYRDADDRQRQALTTAFARSFRLHADLAEKILSGEVEHETREDGSVSFLLD